MHLLNRVFEQLLGGFIDAAKFFTASEVISEFVIKAECLNRCSWIRLAF